ncbi:radical SAM protein [Citrobacter freundii]|uniref:B12-binding domain-containing radical SAM protein n=1 Tax=Citrobacter portucalensis TaxID=1639133 RepID=UPI0019004E80|nr:radical SAM protein [Citrobacter freundii]MBJ8872694.1 radical SAM protein [Citrobacter braakii]MBJ8904279.1 radical SAM protein [Citrobacter braakii]MBJ8907532.1 radical SAM protein [Citrobacter braakii]MBJ8922919.1 radical SAM protein [Citrobacter braakii]
MKLTLIKPNIGRKEHSLYVDEGRMEPLMLGILAALTPPDVEVVLYDDRMEQIPYDEQTDLVAITVETFTARRAYEIADEYRQRGVKVVMGGIHATLLPEEVALYADSVFTGDAETRWQEMIDDARVGRLKARYDAPVGVGQVDGCQRALLPRREIFRDKGYLPISLMQFSRGCRFACNFCAVSQYFGRRHYLRQIDDVVREITEQNSRFIFFVDDNIASDHRALAELCHALIPLNVNWISQASLDVTQNRPLMTLMEKSGCWGNVMGFESITPASLHDARKSPNVRGFNHYRDEIATLRDFGLQTWAAFTLGYDHDTPDSIARTVDFALQNRFAFAAYNILMPYPNTPLYRQLQQQERLLFDGKWWLHPEYRFNQAAFLPQGMSPDLLTELCHQARSRFNTLPSIVRRFSDLRMTFQSLSRMSAFWRYTLLFRKEVHKKHRMRFGLR